MTRPTREAVAAVFEALSNEEYRGNHEWYQAIGECRDAVLSLFPEGRSEQDHAKTAEAFGHAVEAMRLLEADLSAARLRIKALETALRELHNGTLAIAKAKGLKLATSGSARELYDRVEGLLSSAQGETKEGFDGLPELPCGEQPGATAPATAALADEGRAK